jgi:HSP20 family protein
VEPKRKGDMPGFQRLQHEVDKMFLDLLRGERAPRYGRAAFRPNADVYYDKREDVVVVKFELPGVDPGEVSLDVEENVLRVSGVRSDQRHPEVVFQQMEISYGRFERAVVLPPEVDATKATASYSGGYLEIVLPVKPRSAGKRIAIIATDDAREEQES